MLTKKLFIFGMGYTSSYVAQNALALGFQVVGTVRNPEQVFILNQASSMTYYAFDGQIRDEKMVYDIQSASHIISSIPPHPNGDNVAEILTPLFKNQPKKWLGYLSSTSVYGDHKGATVSEDTPINVHTLGGKAKERYCAEQQWQYLADTTGNDLAIFRISGIYGRGRSALDRVREGTIQRIDKMGHVFNRIHVVDLAGAITKALTITPESPYNNTGIFNVADDMPRPAHVVAEFACDLMGVTPPPLTPYAQANLSPKAQQFWQDSKVIDNTRLKDTLGYILKYPTYRHGLQALLRQS